MAQPRKKEKSFTPNNDPLSLEGLEPLLEEGSLDFTPTPLVESTVSESLSETRLILDLMSQLEVVNDLVLETSFQLVRTKNRVEELEGQLAGEDALVCQIKELETWLEALQAENTLLKRPWWKKILGIAP